MIKQELSIEANEQTRADIAELNELNEQIAKLTAKRDEVTNRIKDTIGNNDILTIGGAKVASYQVVISSRFNKAKCIKAIGEDAYNSFCAESITRRFLLHKAK